MNCTKEAAQSKTKIDIQLLNSPLTHSHCNLFVQEASSSSSGAVSSFLGITRDNFKGKSVKELEYEAYEKMAVKQLNDLGI